MFPNGSVIPSQQYSIFTCTTVQVHVQIVGIQSISVSKLNTSNLLTYYFKAAIFFKEGGPPTPECVISPTPWGEKTGG